MRLFWGRGFWVWCVFAGFLQGVLFLLIVSLVLSNPPDPVKTPAHLLAACALVTTAWGHLVYLAFYFRRLQRAGINLRIPKWIARVLLRILDGLSQSLDGI